ncbi:dethiobiotin synthase [Chlamydiifrater phoenicopteri]|uniref:dethiobiotin synthase n=1 Tax=Chlamydiifrater phoenicopteri TaxID=2681469 RepID=UPI001BCAD962|nr:dethiobiotin synthase [Chlamydiifrater phoenicopteri]
MNIIVSGINTGVGKTLASAILVKMLSADYWKPIQAGSLDNRDSDQVYHLTQCVCHPEAYLLRHPLSPHKASKVDGVSLDEHDLKFPETNNPLIIEMSGGFLSPFHHRSQGDIFSETDSRWVLVCRDYLGSINHTLLTIEAMQNRNLSLLGIILNEYDCEDSLWLKQKLDLPVIGTINREKDISPSVINHYANAWSLCEMMF